MDQKNNLIISAAVALLVILAGISYILFKDDIRTTNNKEKVDTDRVETSSSIETLDINSRLVQSLYSKVGLVNDLHNRYATYGESDNLLVSEMSDEDKLSLVYTNLLSHSFKTVPNENLDQEITTNNSSYNYQLLLTSYGYINFIPFSDVELGFKELFGQNETFSKGTTIRADSDSILIYVYNNFLNGYVLYSNVGGIEGRISYGGRIVSAKKSDKNITITEEVTATTPEGNPATIGTYIYTFNIDDDGMYSFVSRIKE